MGHCTLMKLDLNSCTHIKQCVMEDEFSFRKVIGNAFRYQVNRKSPFSSFRLGSHMVVIVVIIGNRKQV